MYITRFLEKSGLLTHPISFLSFLLLGIMFINFGCSKNDMATNNNGDTPGANEVFIQGMAFSPANRTISVGTSIKWTDKESITHTITSGVPGAPSGLFDSGNIGSNGTFSFTFNQAGTFKYYCKIHSSMTGTITVQ